MYLRYISIYVYMHTLCVKVHSVKKSSINSQNYQNYLYLNGVSKAQTPFRDNKREIVWQTPDFKNVLTSSIQNKWRILRDHAIKAKEGKKYLSLI